MAFVQAEALALTEKIEKDVLMSWNHSGRRQMFEIGIEVEQLLACGLPFEQTEELYRVLYIMTQGSSRVLLRIIKQAAEPAVLWKPVFGLFLKLCEETFEHTFESEIHTNLAVKDEEIDQIKDKVFATKVEWERQLQIMNERLEGKECELQSLEALREKQVKALEHSCAVWDEKFVALTKDRDDLQLAFNQHKSEAQAAFSALEAQHARSEEACHRNEETIQQLQKTIELVTNQKKMQAATLTNQIQTLDRALKAEEARSEQLRQSVNDGLAANVRCMDEVRAQKEMAHIRAAELEAEWTLRLERLRLEAKALEQQREETHDKLQEELQLTSRLRKELAELRAVGEQLRGEIVKLTEEKDTAKAETDMLVKELAVVQVQHRDAMLVSRAEADEAKAELERKNADLVKQCLERSETIRELRHAGESMRLKLIDAIAQCHWDVAAEQVSHESNLAKAKQALTMSQVKMRGQMNRMAAELSLRRLQAIRANKRHQAWMTVAKGKNLMGLREIQSLSSQVGKLTQEKADIVDAHSIEMREMQERLRRQMEESIKQCSELRDSVHKCEMQIGTLEEQLNRSKRATEEMTMKYKLLVEDMQNSESRVNKVMQDEKKKREALQKVINDIQIKSANAQEEIVRLESEIKLLEEVVKARTTQVQHASDELQKAKKERFHMEKHLGGLKTFCLHVLERLKHSDQEVFLLRKTNHTQRQKLHTRVLELEEAKANAELELETRELERESVILVKSEREQIGAGGGDRVYQPSDDPDRLPNRMLMHVERVLGQSADAMWASFEDKMVRKQVQTALDMVFTVSEQQMAKLSRLKERLNLMLHRSIIVVSMTGNLAAKTSLNKTAQALAQVIKLVEDMDHGLNNVLEQMTERLDMIGQQKMLLMLELQERRAAETRIEQEKNIVELKLLQALETIEHYKAEIRRVTDQLAEVKSGEQRKVWHALGATDEKDTADGQVLTLDSIADVSRYPFSIAPKDLLEVPLETLMQRLLVMRHQAIETYDEQGTNKVEKKEALTQQLDGMPQVVLSTLQLAPEGSQKPWRVAKEGKSAAATESMRLDESDEEPEMAVVPSFEKGRKKPPAPKLFFSVQTVLQTRGTVPKPQSRFKAGGAVEPKHFDSDSSFAQTKGWPQIVAEFEEEKRKEVALVKLDTARLQTEVVELRGVISVLEDDKLAMRRQAHAAPKKPALAAPEPEPARAREPQPATRRHDEHGADQLSGPERSAPMGPELPLISVAAMGDDRQRLDSGASSRTDSRHSARSVMTPAASTRPGVLAQPFQPLSTKLESHLASQLGLHLEYCDVSGSISIYLSRSISMYCHVSRCIAMYRHLDVSCHLDVSRCISMYRQCTHRCCERVR
jgi:chromosome segregation ATPase